ncbi:AMP-binding protein, partial [candidate division GN15 bacterium]|nr:AMP-binding protein [candidate division GN15 bacterium]
MSISNSLWTAFADRLAEHGERTALITTERRVSFGQVAHEAEQLAGRLAELGVQAGDVLGLALPNRPSLIPACLALCKLDTTVALVSTKYRQQELQAIVRHTGLRGFLCTAEDARRLAELLELSSPITHPLDNNDDIVALMLEATSVALPEP